MKNCIRYWYECKWIYSSCLSYTKWGIFIEGLTFNKLFGLICIKNYQTLHLEQVKRYSSTFYTTLRHKRLSNTTLRTSKALLFYIQSQKGWLIGWCFMPTLAIFQLHVYRDVIKFYYYTYTPTGSLERKHKTHFVYKTHLSCVL
jgi:hypothetical protein